MTVRTGPRKQLPGSRFLLAGAVFAYGMAFGSMPDVDEIKLPGDYSEHLHDVCFDGKALYWAHTSWLIKSYVLDNVPVKLGIETIKHRGGYAYLCPYFTNGLAIKLDKDFKEIGRYTVDGSCGLVFDGSYVWTGETRRNAETKKWRSRLKRRKAPTGF